MTIQQIKLHCAKQPFMPFVLHVADGSAIPVDHPELLFINDIGLTITVHLNDRSARVLDLLLISQIEIPAPTVETN